MSLLASVVAVGLTLVAQELARDAHDAKAKEMFRWSVDVKKYTAAREHNYRAAVIVAQSLVRRFLERCRWSVHVEAKARHVGASIFQKHWRRLVARRLVEAKKRVKYTQSLHRWHRRQLGKLLRALGYTNRQDQRFFVETFLSPIGLDPTTFTLGLNTIGELKADMELFFDELAHYKDVSLPLSLTLMLLSLLLSLYC